MKRATMSDNKTAYAGENNYPTNELCREIANDAAGIEINLAHNKAAIDIGARAMMLWYRQKS
jgi:hypothetical protein